MNLALLQPRLAVVEDNAHVAKAICHLAAKMGFTPHHYPTAADLLHADPARPPQGLILDLGLPDADGISLLDHIQTHFPTCGIIVVSGMEPTIIHAAGQLIEERGLPLIGTLHKPFHLKALQALLVQIRGERRHKERPPEEPREPITPQLLREAIEQRQFIPYYQPQTTTRDGEIVGFEALMRWNHPQWGIVSPARFIPLAARCGLLDRMTWIMLEQVARHWQQRNWEGITVSVNLPASFLDQEQLPERITRLIAGYGMHPACLVLEVTESEAMADIPRQHSNLIRLRVAGFPLSIDDFGTGYSSLISLYQLPFDELKIDQAFVMRADSDPVALEIIRALVFLARHLKMTLIAEGVETETIRRLLLEAGVARIQGYLVHEPMPFDALKKWRETYRPAPLASPEPPAAALPAKALLDISQQTLNNEAEPLATTLVEALRARKEEGHFQPLFAALFAAGTSITRLLTLLLRSEWMLLQQAMPAIQKLPDAEQYQAIRDQLDFFERLRRLAVETKEQEWQQRLEQSEHRAHKEHLDRILAENSVVWLRRRRVKLVTYLDEVPIQAQAKVVDIIGHIITVALDGEVAKVLAVNDYRAHIATQDNRERIAVEMLKLHNGNVRLALGEITPNHIGQRHHVRVRHPDQPEVTLAIHGQPAIHGRLVDISIAGARLALPATAAITRRIAVRCSFTLADRTINGKGIVRWTRDTEEQRLCGINLHCSSNDQRLLQEETLRLQRDLITRINNAKLPVLLQTALDAQE